MNFSLKVWVMTNRTALKNVPGILALVTSTWTFYVGRHKHTSGVTNVGKIFKEPNLYFAHSFQGMYSKTCVETSVNFEILACQ